LPFSDPEAGKGTSTRPIIIPKEERHANEGGGPNLDAILDGNALKCIACLNHVFHGTLLWESVVHEHRLLLKDLGSATHRRGSREGDFRGPNWLVCVVVKKKKKVG